MTTDFARALAVVSDSAKPAKSGKLLRNWIAARLTETSQHGVQLSEKQAKALAGHLLSLGHVEGVWAGTRTEPRACHSFRLTVDEFLKPRDDS